MRTVFALLLSVSANIHAMSISIAPPSLGAKLMDMDNYVVQLSGDISIGDANQLETRLKKLVAPDRYFSFYLDSPGGNLLEGMKIGRLIRKYGLSTNIGRHQRDDKGALPGACLSACTLSYLGGQFRYIVPGSIYGVHRFHRRSNTTANDLELAQIVSAAVSSYIREMDVDPELLNYMTAAGKDDMNILTDHALVDLNVVNNGRQRAKWTIEVVEGATYLRGEQLTVWGLGRVMFVCWKDTVIMRSVAPVGEKGKMMLSQKWVHSLLIDGETVPIPTPQAREEAEGFLTSFIPLNAEMLTAVINANKSIGQAIQTSRSDFRFVGYQLDIPKHEQGRVRTYLKNCSEAR